MEQLVTKDMEAAEAAEAAQKCVAAVIGAAGFAPIVAPRATPCRAVIAPVSTLGNGVQLGLRGKSASWATMSIPDWSVPVDGISALEVSQLCHLFLGRRTRTVWLLAILLLHVSAMWACVAIWVLCAHGAIRGAIS